MTTPINYFFNRRLEQSGFHTVLLLAALLLTLSGCATDRPGFHIVSGRHEAGWYWDHKEACKPEAAVKEFTKAIEMALDPRVTASLEHYDENDKNSDLTNAYTERGNIKSQYLNDPKGAIEDYTEAIKYSEELPDSKHTMWSRFFAYEGRSKCKEQLNDHKGALADLEHGKILRTRADAYDQTEYDRQAKIEAEKQAKKQAEERQYAKEQAAREAAEAAKSPYQRAMEREAAEAAAAQVRKEWAEQRAERQRLKDYSFTGSSSTYTCTEQTGANGVVTSRSCRYK